MRNRIINIILFECGWFACVLGGASGKILAGFLVALAIVVLHLLRSEQWRTELALVLSAMLIGFTWDSALVFSGWIHYPHGQLFPYTVPVWIVMMWDLFATTLNVSLNWLKQRVLLSMVFGAIGGPMAFLGGARLGAVEFTSQSSALIALAIGWAVLTPVLLQVATLLNGVGNESIRSTS